MSPRDSTIVESFFSSKYNVESSPDIVSLQMHYLLERIFKNVAATHVYFDVTRKCIRLQKLIHMDDANQHQD